MEFTGRIIAVLQPRGGVSKAECLKQETSGRHRNMSLKIMTNTRAGCASKYSETTR